MPAPKVLTFKPILSSLVALQMWSLKTRNKNQPKDVQEILQEASERAKALLVTVDNCRDATIKKTGEDASQVLGEVQFIGWKAIEIREAVGNIDKRQNMQMSTLESVQRTQDVMVDLANKIRANYEDNFRAHHNKFQITLTRLESLLRQQETGIISDFDF
ncbi:hypothetical protein CFRS1_v005155 [Colletotrichum fructicola]|nr:hypothetical protein CFRS1_v005155 [Colletotrichum fructicola]